MILIPSLETVVILVPRTASGSIKRAVLAKYPDAILLYRHMEASGIPFGYEHWEKIAVVREPTERLYSLWKFMQGYCTHPNENYRTRLKIQGARPFEDWLLNNQDPFTDPFDSSSCWRYYPQFAVQKIMPENKKSQWHYLRPDLNTTIYRFSELRVIERRLDITLNLSNQTNAQKSPELSLSAKSHIETIFSWDLDATR